MIHMLADFDLGHKDHISIPTKEWSQIPSSLCKKIRTIEKKGTGDLTGVYEQARQHADFNTMYLICDAMFGKINPKSLSKVKDLVTETMSSNKGRVFSSKSGLRDGGADYLHDSFTHTQDYLNKLL